VDPEVILMVSFVKHATKSTKNVIISTQQAPGSLTNDLVANGIILQILKKMSGGEVCQSYHLTGSTLATLEGPMNLSHLHSLYFGVA